MLRKLHTAVRVLRTQGLQALGAIVSEKAFRIGHMGPLGTVRIGKCWFKADARGRDLMLSGNYESHELAALEALLPHDYPVVELGGCFGVVSCTVNQKLAKPEAHTVVEANPYVLPYLSANRQRNRSRFEIIHAAIGYTEKCRFYIGMDMLAAGRFSESADYVDVPAITVAEILARQAYGTCSLICDIEGAEIELIANEMNTLAQKVRLMVVEMHPAVVGEEACRDALSSLAAAGFEIVFQRGDTYAVTNPRLPYSQGA